MGISKNAFARMLVKKLSINATADAPFLLRDYGAATAP